MKKTTKLTRFQFEMLLTELTDEMAKLGIIGNVKRTDGQIKMWGIRNATPKETRHLNQFEKALKKRFGLN